MVLTAGCLSGGNPIGGDGESVIGSDPDGLTELKAVASLSVVNPLSSSSTVTNPIIQVNGVLENDLLKVYSDSNCSNELASSRATSSTVSVQLSSLDIGQHTFYAKRLWPEKNLESPCSTEFVAYEVVNGSMAVTGLSNEADFKKSKSWSWSCSGATTSCEYRHTINSSPSHLFSTEPYGAITTASQASGDGAYFLHVQVRDVTYIQAESDVATVVVTLDNISPFAPSAISLSSPVSSPSNDSTPSVEAFGVNAGDTIRVFTDTSCSAEVGSASSSGSSVVVTSSALTGGVYSFYATATDLAGNVSGCSAASVSYMLDVTAPVLSLTSAPDINVSNQSNYQVVGTCSEEGRTVDVFVGGVRKAVNCSSSAFLSNNMNISGEGDSSTLAVSVTQNDAAGNTGVSATTIAKDVVTAQVLISSAPAIDNSNATSYTVSGTCTHNGNVVTVAVGSLNFTPNCASGAWSTGNVDVSNLGDSTNLLITANHLTATPATATVIKDTAAPTVVINSFPDISLANESNYQVSGSCSENGQNVAVMIVTLSYSINCSSGSWSTGYRNVSTLVDGGSITISASHSTANQAIKVVTKNTATPSVASLSVSGTLTNSAELAWALVDPGGFTVNDYHINYRIQGTSTWLPYTDGVTIATSADVTSLNPSTSYEFRVRVQYDSSNYSGWSNTASGETKPDNPLFSSSNKAMNVGGATQSMVVAHQDNTYVTLNGVTISASPLNAGQKALLTTSQYDVIDADKPIFTAGRRGSGSDVNKANVVWSPTSWAGKSFSFNAIRYNTQELYVYATEDSVVQLKQGSNVLGVATIASGGNANLVWSVYGSYQVISTGTVLAYHISTQNGSRNVDPKPLLPSSTEIIGFPSNSMRLTTDADSTNYNFLHSNSAASSGGISKQGVVQVNGQGSPRDRYRGNSLLVTADQKVSGASFADSDGGCASPFLPTNLMKKNYVINVDAQWVAFASKQGGSIAVYSPSQTIGVDTPVATLNLIQSGGNSNAPFRIRKNSTTPAGYRFVSTVPVAGWYEPRTDTGGANNDETIMYGTDE